jgi:predicted hotdog family 3-hydroxylacyl-ACP dehydratase
MASAGRVPSLVAVELGAQATAFFAAAAPEDSSAASNPRIGLLVALRGASFHVPWLRTGVSLRVVAEHAGGAAALSMFRITVSYQDEPQQCLAEADLSTFLTPREVVRVDSSEPPAGRFAGARRRSVD